MPFSAGVLVVRLTVKATLLKGTVRCCWLATNNTKQRPACLFCNKPARYTQDSEHLYARGHTSRKLINDYRRPFFCPFPKATDKQQTPRSKSIVWETTLNLILVLNCLCLTADEYIANVLCISDN